MSASKRDELVQKALEVFYANGFHATGMDRLVAETGISKTSMYKHFRTKEDLILATLRLRDEQFRNKVMRRVEELADSPRDRLLASFDMLTEWMESDSFNSCMFIKASSEYQDADHPIHRVAAEHKRLLTAYLEGLAEKAGAADPAGLSRHLMMLKEGAIVTAHLHGPKGVGADAREAAEVLIAAAIPA
jgi:AcrR family transcriptional regulator